MCSNARDNHVFEAKLEEYRQLREEIRHYLQRRQQNINFAIIVTVGVVGVGLRLNNYILFLSSALLICFLWFDEIRRVQAVFRVGSYIEVFIESEVRGLKWETLGARHKIQTSFLSRLIANGIYPLLFLLNAILGLSFIIKMDKNLAIIIAILFIIVFFSLSVRSFYVSTKGRQNEATFWGKQKQEKIEK